MEFVLRPNITIQEQEEKNLEEEMMKISNHVLADIKHSETIDNLRQKLDASEETIMKLNAVIYDLKNSVREQKEQVKKYQKMTKMKDYTVQRLKSANDAWKKLSCEQLRKIDSLTMESSHLIAQRNSLFDTVASQEEEVDDLKLKHRDLIAHKTMYKLAFNELCLRKRKTKTDELSKSVAAKKKRSLGSGSVLTAATVTKSSPTISQPVTVIKQEIKLETEPSVMIASGSSNLEVSETEAISESGCSIALKSDSSECSLS